MAEIVALEDDEQRDVLHVHDDDTGRRIGLIYPSREGWAAYGTTANEAIRTPRLGTYPTIRRALDAITADA
jgi:hypothetical protein